MQPDKINGNVLYYDDTHSYIDRDTNEKFTSVTTLIHKYTLEFDEDFWSSYKALEALMDNNFDVVKKMLLATKKFNEVYLTKFKIDKEEFYNKKQEIITSYATERDKSCERGTKIHADFENSFYKNDKEVNTYGFTGSFICKKDYYEFDLEKGVYPEYLIHKTSEDGILKIAGQIDLLIKDGNDITIIDFKTNKEIKQKSYFNRNKKKYECMKYPLNNIMDCNFMHYTIQLSLYAYLLQQINPEFNIKELKILHVDHDNKKTWYDIEYRKQDVERMLIHYKKQIKMLKELQKDAKR